MIDGYLQNVSSFDRVIWELRYAKNKSLGNVTDVETHVKGLWRKALISKAEHMISRDGLGVQKVQELFNDLNIETPQQLVQKLEGHALDFIKVKE